MPFASESQRRFLWAKHPKIAKKWADEEKKSSLEVKRGLIQNTLKVDGQDYKVNDGYLKPAGMGFVIGGGASLIGNMISGNKIGIVKALGAGSLGVLTLMGITEAKRRQIQNIFNKDPESAKALVKKGLSIKPRYDIGNPKLEWMSDIIRDQNESLGQELLKSASLNELKMIRRLDDTETDANIANFGLEASGALAILSDTSRPGNLPDIDVKNSAPFVLVSKDKNRFGTRHFNINQFKSNFPKTWAILDDSLKDKIKERGAIALSHSDLNNASMLREASRSVNRSKLMSTLSDIPSKPGMKLVNRATTVYSFMGSGDDKMADAAAGAQFVMHTPRTVEDIISTVRAGKLDKKSILRNVMFSGTRALPALLPIVGRIVRKHQDSNS
jgi:hypothetical protein